ncbi:4Fe-4S binding protein [Helicovermis profundi]|uniref:Pyruvate synthase subunit PorD n=1 Tax=Helicovermis profundi TaxID=3065157 RepID=A0AAU9E1R5_9FIRM|nr:pyruvate synthase subunit PorD [Clostridia bacterium S502]
MNKPKLKKWKEPINISNYPLGATCESNHLVSINAGWRTYRPVINQDKCVKCLRCFLVCPDGVIDKSKELLEIDYDYCKGCGVCAYECKFDAIDMVKEEK